MQVVKEAVKVLKALEKARPSVGHFNFQEHLLGGVRIPALYAQFHQLTLCTVLH